ncbi:MAG: hypothetical protein ABIJ16_10245, partial [Bacteroidota bacterium]
MSTIGGIFYKKGETVNEQQVSDMMKALEHWNPDRKSYWINSCYGCGHLMMKNSPLSLNDYQPLIAGHIVIVSDAR